MTTRQARGRLAEQRACVYLEAQGLRLLERNYRCRAGEIDLIMRDGEALVFVEVRLRTNPGFGGALMSVDRFKRARLIACAQHYLQTSQSSCAARFDIITIDAGERLDWVRNAFDA
ncbi:MAG: YraN family protein [Gammaproteobacteria bacterium]